MKIEESIKSAILQLLVVLFVGLTLYMIRWLFSKKNSFKISLKDYLGLTFSKQQFDLQFGYVFFGLIVYAVLTTYLQFNYSTELKAMLMNDSSPYFKILKNGFGFTELLLGVIYCFIQAGGSEELLFRGIIAKRLYSLLGKFYGNIVQAIIFWIVHLFIFRLVTGYWVSYLQLFAFITSFGIGLINGWVNFRNDGRGIFPSWLLHSSLNFITFLTLAFLISN